MNNTGWTVIGGELVDVASPTPQWRNPDAVHYVGVYDTWEQARDAWKANSWLNVDNALMRYFIHPVSGDTLSS